MTNLESMTEVELLQTHGAVIDELMRRGVVRTRNNPIGDYTEWLVCKHLALEMQGNSQAAFDAIDDSEIRYQIKGRQSEAKKVQFSAIRNFDQQGFDFVIAVVFNKDYSIRFAAKLTHAAVADHSTYREHTNAHILILDESSLSSDGVGDITGELNGKQ
jgi:hypothetical protein